MLFDAQKVSLKGIDAPFSDVDLHSFNVHLEGLSAHKRVAWAIEQFGDRLILSSSFGAQAAVSLHLVITLKSDVPVILIDTGYLFPETYHFVDELRSRLSLNLRVYRAEMSTAWQEARYGRLWEKGVKGIELYNQINKVEPMKRALIELRAKGWISGIRRSQSVSRKAMPVIVQDGACLKIHPIIDWTDRDVFNYLKAHDLPYHPLWQQGYLSIGDVHTTRKVDANMAEEEARFFGLKRECGLHEGVNPDFSI